MIVHDLKHYCSVSLTTTIAALVLLKIFFPSSIGLIFMLHMVGVDMHMSYMSAHVEPSACFERMSGTATTYPGSPTVFLGCYRILLG